MSTIGLQFLNYFFFIFHTLLIIFNLFGWIWKPTRTLNLFTLLLTAFSWVVLGIWYGWGYCFLTDWHYNILEKLGHTGLPDSYIAFLTQSISGYLPGKALVNSLTLLTFLAALACSLWVNFRKRD